MRTLAELIDTHGIEVHDHLNREELIPAHKGLQLQGDVAIIPTRPSPNPGETIPAEGIPVVRGENGGNTHLLLADGPATWHAHRANDLRDLVLGTVTIPDETTGYLAHPEHGYIAIAPGCYQIRRQREQADEIRRVAD